MARHAGHGLAERDADVRLPRAEGTPVVARQRRNREPRLRLRRRRRDGLIACAERGAPGDVYNLASGVETEIRELAETIIRLSDSSSTLDIAPARDWDRSGHRFGSTVKSERALGFRAATDLEEGLRRTIEWTRESLPLIEACIARHAHRLAEPIPA